MRIMCRRFLFFLLFTILLMLIACSNRPAEMFEIGDGGFLSEKPSGPPCFINICPGVATKDDVVKLLEEKSVYQDCRFFDNTRESGGKGFSCARKLLFVFQDRNIVSAIGFEPDKEITVEEVVRKYGNPSAVHVNNSNTPASPPSVGMLLYFDDLKVSIILPDQKSSYYNLTPETRIRSIGYSDNNSYKMTRQYFQEWKGYIEYSPYFP